MRKIWVIAIRELEAYFKSPMAYIILVITIGVFNVFFFMIIDQNREASLRDTFQLMEFMFVFIIPLLTMKMFAEEKRAGTLEFLLTCPTRNFDIVLGKYFGNLIFFTILIGLTFVYYLILEHFGQPDKAATFVGYFGVWLEGALFIAIGMLTSSWTKNQIIAALSSYAILFVLYFSVVLTKFFDPQTQNIIKHIGCLGRMENFGSGLMTSADLVYYFSGIIFCILLTNLSIEKR